MHAPWQAYYCKVLGRRAWFCMGVQITQNVGVPAEGSERMLVYWVDVCSYVSLLATWTS